MEELEKNQRQYFTDGLHVQFVTDAENLFSKLDPQKFDIAPQLDTLHLEFVREGDCYKVVRKSDFSELKEILDDEYDTTVFNIRNAIRMGSRHFKLEVKEATKRVKIVYDTYNQPVPIVNQPYDVETASIAGFLTDLNKDYASEIGISDLREWLAELNRLNTKLTESNNKQKAQRADLKMTETRKKVNFALKNIIKVIEAEMIKHTEINYNDFIAEWDTHIKHYNDIWA
jgi:hypothetical protein